MKNPKACFLMPVLCIVLSCTKEPVTTSTSTSSNYDLTEGLNAKTKPLQTIFGLDYKVGGVTLIENKMNIAGVSLVRNQLILSKKISGSFTNKYLEDGYNVQINLNWLSTGFGPVAYPKDLKLVEARAEEFFLYYTPYKSQIPVVVVENEWDNTAFHKGTVQDYLAELAAITQVGHKYGFKIADAGLSSTNLRRWTYSTLNGAAAEKWKENYFVGDKLDGYDLVIQSVNEYAEGVSKIPIDYLNVHWYNIEACYNGFETASKAYLNACNKKLIMTNEFGIKTSSELLFSNTVEELRGRAHYSIAYSGTGDGNTEKAAALTDEMLMAF